MAQTEWNQRNKHWEYVLTSFQTSTVAIKVGLHSVWDKDYLMLKLKCREQNIIKIIHAQPAKRMTFQTQKSVAALTQGKKYMNKIRKLSKPLEIGELNRD